MDLVKSWAVSIGILIVGTIVTFVILIMVLEPDSLNHTGTLLLWSGVPTFIVYALATFAGAAVHPRPARERTGRHVLAVLVPPIIFLLLNVPFSIGNVTLGPVAITFSGIVVGTAVGWVLGDLLRRPCRETGYYGA